MSRNVVLSFLVIMWATQIGVASPLLVTAAGTYDSVTPVSFFTAPSEIWSLSFLIDSNPSISSSSFGVYFSPAFSDFTYSLNGSSVAITPDQIAFWAGPADTPFILSLSICWNGPCAGGTDEGMAFDTSQLYTGSEFSPTIVPGVYPTSEFFIDNGPSYREPNTSLTIASTPEPSAFLLSALGLILLASVAYSTPVRAVRWMKKLLRDYQCRRIRRKAVFCDHDIQFPRLRILRHHKIDLIQTD